MDTLDDFRKAREVLQNVLIDTNLIYSKYFSDVTGNRVYLKPENMQVTGSFKIRGAYYKISTLTKEQKKKGLITSSAGNHAQGVAYGAQQAGARAIIVMPTGTPLVKINNTKRYGAEVILHGNYYDEACEYAMSLAEKENYTFIHPFNDLEVATGQGTIAYEIFKDLPETDIILVPMGGGGLAAGAATFAKLLNPNVKVIGVEPKGAASVSHSVKQGQICSIDKVETIADGVAVQTPGNIVFPFIQNNIDDIIVIDDSEIADAFLDVMESHKMVVENAGLLSVAALKYLKAEDKNVVSILSGGNMDVITMSSLVQHGLINRGRVATVSLHLPDRPGELVKVATIISEERGNVIKLEHNQFVNINRNCEVELKVTLEAFGHAHIETIMNKFKNEGYSPQISTPSSIYC